VVSVREATTSKDFALAADLFREYARWLPFALDFQDFEEELSAFPSHYARPDGCILVCHVDGELAGCVALRPLSEGVCEMKRLYVRPEARGRGAGRALAEAILVRAREIGYDRMRLDTMRSMEEANALYRSLGFREIDPYYENPFSDACFFEIRLRVGGGPERP
jgi:ribosomal protein S18 acetylase RimI-like enzyme